MILVTETVTRLFFLSNGNFNDLHFLGNGNISKCASPIPFITFCQENKSEDLNIYYIV